MPFYPHPWWRVDLQNTLLFSLSKEGPSESLLLGGALRCGISQKTLGEEKPGLSRIQVTSLSATVATSLMNAPSQQALREGESRTDTIQRTCHLSTRLLKAWSVMSAPDECPHRTHSPVWARWAHSEKIILKMGPNPVPTPQILSLFLKSCPFQLSDHYIPILAPAHESAHTHAPCHFFPRPSRYIIQRQRWPDAIASSL